MSDEETLAITSRHGREARATGWSFNSDISKIIGHEKDCTDTDKKC
jgi:hypothetical protein